MLLFASKKNANKYDTFQYHIVFILLYRFRAVSCYCANQQKCEACRIMLVIIVCKKRFDVCAFFYMAIRRIDTLIFTLIQRKLFKIRD